MKILSSVTMLLLISGTIAMATSKAEVEEIMNELLPFGQQMIEKQGEFIPFGGAMKPDGEIVYVAGFDGDEHPSSHDIINLLRDGYRLAARKSQYKATAIFYDVRAIPPGSKEKPMLSQ